MAVNVSCPTCGVTNWLENQNRCFQCGAVLRRCADCTRYDPRNETCKALGTEVSADEANRPGLLSLSVSCRQYEVTEGRRAA